MNDRRNNSWDAFWSDAGKGALALMVGVGFIVLLVFGIVPLLIMLGVLFLIWVFVLA